MNLQFDFEGHVPDVVVGAPDDEAASRLHVFKSAVVPLGDAVSLLKGLDADVAEAAALGPLHEESAGDALLHAELLLLILSVTTSLAGDLLVRGVYASCKDEAYWSQ